MCQVYNISEILNFYVTMISKIFLAFLSFNFFGSGSPGVKSGCTHARRQKKWVRERGCKYPHNFHDTLFKLGRMSNSTNNNSVFDLIFEVEFAI